MCGVYNSAITLLLKQHDWCHVSESELFAGTRYEGMGSDGHAGDTELLAGIWIPADHTYRRCGGQHWHWHFYNGPINPRVRRISGREEVIQVAEAAGAAAAAGGQLNISVLPGARFEVMVYGGRLLCHLRLI